eukprot:559747-Pelagomonas_calceolata.AAC.3
MRPSFATGEGNTLAIAQQTCVSRPLQQMQDGLCFSNFLIQSLISQHSHPKLNFSVWLAEPSHITFNFLAEDHLPSEP